MRKAPWQLQSAVSAIAFDCDGTLTQIEGVDELAKWSGVNDAVESLTAMAMNQGLNPALYRQRLDLIQPSLKALLQLGNQYFLHLVPDANSVITLLRRLQKSVYIISAGMNPAVRLFGRLLQIPENNIFAVDLRFDENGHYQSYNETSPLIYNHGKRNIIRQLNRKHSRIIHIGDGANDIITSDIITRFIGYGGIFYRENIAACSHYYITTTSLSAILPLTLTACEYKKLQKEELTLYHKGLDAIKNGCTFIKDDYGS